MAAGLASPLAGAQQIAAADNVPPPPKLEKLEEGDDTTPTVTIRKPEENKQGVTERRDPGGKVKEVKVTSGKSTYYLKPNDPVGSGSRGDGQSDAIRPAEWHVAEFGGPPAKEKVPPEPQVLAPKPPAPPAENP